MSDREAKLPKPPGTYRDFVGRYPALGKAWELVHKGGEEAGPLDEKTRRLVKLAIAIGAKQEGAVHSSVRKGLAQGISREEMEQVVALAVSTLGFPATVAAFTWVREVE
jgi:alkylhydroperoxidase/carboxymuconolactone decarboxylase family protein YurZ